KLAEGIGGLLGVRQKLVEGIRGLLGVRQELAEGDWELAGNVPRVRKKMTETYREFVRGYREDHWELRKSLDTLVKLIVFVCLSIYPTSFPRFIFRTFPLHTFRIKSSVKNSIPG
ncbi:hypothetical protein BHE74_00043509, partial [Ensete ventricosum]